MSTYILMKILESAPTRYDLGIRILTGNRLNKIYDFLSTYIKKGQTVLDIGCGTGALTIRAAQRGAYVKGIDINSQMLEIAQTRVTQAKLTHNVELCEMGVAELENEQTASYDVIMSGLCFSELSTGELNYTLNEIKRLLTPGGLLLVADEVVPKKHIKRLINWLIKGPLVIITFIITQTKTHALKGLPEKLERAGFGIELTKFNKLENFIVIVARRSKKELV